MTLVHNVQLEGEPATHALVIGVGAYPRLLGGSQPQGPDITENMAQLSSPPISARAMADWLISSHSDPTARLSSVDLLLSEANAPVNYTAPGGEEFPVELATHKNISAAIKAWKARGNENKENVLIFFFCGHGVGRGFDLALLARDYGEDEELPFRHSVWFEGLKEGMKSCAATRQIYFVDACRIGSELLCKTFNQQLDPVIGVRLPFTQGLRQAIYYATTTGEPAFGRLGEPSLFTEYLLRGLCGLGAHDDRGDWWVETTKLQRVLTVLSDEFAPPEYKGLQSPTSGEQVSFEFHRLDDAPRVPFYLAPTWCDGNDKPPANLTVVGVDSEGEEVVRWKHPWQQDPCCSWDAGLFRSDQAAGLRYSWSVSFTDGQEMRSAPRTLNPPFRIVEFPRDGIA